MADDGNKIIEQIKAEAGDRARERAEARQEKQEKSEKNGQIGQIIKWAVILVLFLIITNPSLIPFLSADTKMKVRGTWERLFGDVGRVSKTVILNWVTIFQVIAVILVMFVITNVLSFILNRIKPQTAKGRSLVSLLKSALNYISVLVGFFWCLSALGVNVSTVFASVGILALIIGFGAQSLVEDLVTGIFLVFEDQFNVGDIIEVGGFRGTVDSIGIRTTAIRDMGNNVKIVNNSDLRNVLNKSTADSYAVTTVSISYRQDIEAAEAVIAELMPQIREKYPEIFVADPKYSGVQELGESGVVLKFIAEVDEKNIFSAPRLLNREIKIAFDKAGIEIPFNQIVVHQAKE
jgi:small conductance mechanosensitive channel